MAIDRLRRMIYGFDPYIRMARVQVAKWGNGLALRLPAAVVEALQLQPGDDVVMRVADARELVVARKPSREDILARLRPFRGRLPEDFVFDRDEANAR
jgi:antitoxin MazE